MVNERSVRPNAEPGEYEDDPYEADSDDEYEPLEAERADAWDVVAQAKEFEAVDATIFTSEDDEDVESMAPGRAQDRERLEDLDEALDESVQSDPEAIAMGEARRRSLVFAEDDGLGPPDELQEALDELIDRTPLTTEDLEEGVATDDLD